MSRVSCLFVQRLLPHAAYLVSNASRLSRLTSSLPPPTSPYFHLLFLTFHSTPGITSHTYTSHFTPSFPSSLSRAPARAFSSSSSTSSTMSLSGIPYDDDNVFKKIVEGTIPSYKIFETEHALAFLDAFPMCKARTESFSFSRARRSFARRLRCAVRHD